LQMSGSMMILPPRKVIGTVFMFSPYKSPLVN
jgi:hypothetical protein